MVALDEDALICDLAETYRIYDYKGLPLRTVATLSSGLRDNSRIKMKASGMKVSAEMLMYARMVDALNFISWTKTVAAEKGENRPVSLFDIFTGREQKEEKQFETFNTPEEFEKARNQIISQKG